MHPILVSFPIAFFTGALIFDVLQLIYDRSFNQTAVYLLIAGLIGAVAAAIPGVIDFIFTVPPKVQGKKEQPNMVLPMLPSYYFLDQRSFIVYNQTFRTIILYWD